MSPPYSAPRVISSVFARSTGVDAAAATKPAPKEASVWQSSPSDSPSFSSRSLKKSYLRASGGARAGERRWSGGGGAVAPGGRAGGRRTSRARRR